MIGFFLAGVVVGIGIFFIIKVLLITSPGLGGENTETPTSPGLGGENTETPNITYDISDDLKIIRTQNGLEDTFAKVTLYRKLNNKWYGRSSCYASVFKNRSSMESYLLSKEKEYFEPLK